MKPINRELIHGIRNALTIIIGNVYAMKFAGCDKSSCDAVLRGAERINKVIDNLEKEY